MQYKLRNIWIVDESWEFAAWFTASHNRLREKGRKIAWDRIQQLKERVIIPQRFPADRSNILLVSYIGELNQPRFFRNNCCHYEEERYRSEKKDKKDQ